MNDTFEQICKTILKNTKNSNFKERKLNIEAPEISEIYFLRKNNLIMNSGIVIIKINPDLTDINYSKLCKRIKFRIAFKVLFVPFLYAFYHQFIIVDENIIDDDSNYNLSNVVDSVDNQISITQSITLIDSARKKYIHSRTWGQVISGKFQNAILKSLEQLSCISSS
jgi:hypothetical protein